MSDQLAADGLPATRKAIRECGCAMVEMLRIGWSNADLDWLERCWWQVRDHNGKVMRAALVDTAPPPWP